MYSYGMDKPVLNGGYCLEYLAGCPIPVALFPAMLFRATFPLSDSVFSKLLAFWFMRVSLFLNSVRASKGIKWASPLIKIYRCIAALVL